MKIVVAKFGGSSLSEAGQLRRVKAIVMGDENRRVIVPSAPGKRFQGDHKVTDLLIMCHQLASHRLSFEEVFVKIRVRYEGICEELGVKADIGDVLDGIYQDIDRGASRDYSASRGEYVNGLILADYLGYDFLDPKDLIIFKDKNHLDEETTRKAIAQAVGSEAKVVIPGFYGGDGKGGIRCFSRGGSDVTGAIIADALHAELYENWTDVSGFLAADPNIVENPDPISTITFRELRELSYMGANVLHEDAIFPIRRLGIPIQVRNTNVPKDPGTRIVPDSEPSPLPGLITGISGRKNFTVISLEKLRMTEDHAFFRKLMSVFESNDVTIAHMPSAIDAISVIVDDRFLNGKLSRILEELRIYLAPDTIEVYPAMALIAVVGRGMISTKGISARIFGALAADGINIRMITQGSSEISIIIGVENRDFAPAIGAVYHAFFQK